MDYLLLGSLEVRDDDGPLPLGGAKQRALLALLLLNANQVVSRDRLVDELWGESPPNTAVQGVQVYVSRLRRLLPPETLLTRPPGYLLAAVPETIDLRRFERLVADARGADPERASRLLGEALQLWRGPALAEFGEEPFALTEAGRLEDLRLAALEDRMEADLALGRHRELVGELEALIAAHPHRERLRAQLMLALYRSGRQAEALQAYRDGRAALDELGIEPGAALRELERAILAQDAALSGPSPLLEAAPSLPGPLVPASPFPFVGRERELKRLRLLLEQVDGGEGGVVLLSGEPGAGKTRLVRELAQEAVARGVLVLYGASSATISVPYQPLVEWLEFVLRVCDAEAFRASLGTSGRALGLLVPELARLTGPAQPSGDAETDRYLLQTAAVEVLTRMSRVQPLLLVVDDLHWSDAETLHLLRRLARTVPETRIVVLAAFRDPGEEIGPDLVDALADLSRLDAVTRLSLGGLSADEVGAFIRASTDAEATPGLASELGELTDGTPLLLCELWRDLRDTGAVEVLHGSARLSRPVGELRGPERIRDLVRQRLSRLPPQTRAVVETAAVAGPRFELPVLGKATGLEPALLLGRLDEAAEAGLLEALPEPALAWRFTHELLRRAVYDRLKHAQRVELHLHVGEALEQVHVADLARVLPELAHHFTIGAPVSGAERAVEYNLRAAEAATASVAYREAAARLSTALELGIADPLQRIRVQTDLGYLFHEIGQLAESDALLTASLEAATGLEELGLATRAFVHTLRQRLDNDPSAGSTEFVALAEDAINTFEQLGDLRGLAMAEYLLGDALGREGRTEESFAALDRALAHAEAGGDQVLRGDVIGRIARRLCESTTPVGEAIVRIEELRSQSRDVPSFDAGVRLCLGVVLAMAGRFDESRGHMQESNRALGTVDRTSHSVSSRWLVAEARELAGDLAGAQEELVAAFLSLRDMRGGQTDSTAQRAAAMLALFYCDEGRWNEAADCLAYGEEVDNSDAPAGKIYAVLRLAARARLAAHDGRVAEALELARRAVELAERSDWLNYRARVWLALAEVNRAAGRTAEADTAVATALVLLEQKGNVAAAARLREASG